MAAPAAAAASLSSASSVVPAAAAAAAASASPTPVSPFKPVDIRIGWVDASILTLLPHDRLPFNETSVQHEHAPWMVCKREGGSSSEPSPSAVTAPDEEVVVERTWLEAQVPVFQQWVHASFPGASLRLVEQPLSKPHAVDSFNKAHLHMFTLFFRTFDYHVWWTEGAVPETKLVKLEPRHKAALNKCMGRCVSGRPLDSSQLEDLEEVRDLLRGCFNDWETCDGREWFVRMSACSGKRDEPLRPLTSVRAMLDFLTSCRNFYAREFQQADKDSYIVVTPWLGSALQPRLELRLFIHERRLTAASQQHCYSVYRYSERDLTLLKAALSGRDETHSLQRLIDSVCYSSFVADAFIDTTTGALRLIECNPYGEYSGSGGGLFSWVHDGACLRAERDEHTPVLRLLAAPADEDFDEF